MPSLDERVAYLEGRLEDHASAVTFLRADVRGVHEDLRSFREEMRYFRDDMGHFRDDMGHFRDDMRHSREEMRHFRDEFRQELHRVDDKVSRHFTWLVGLQVGVLLAVLGALLGR